MPSYEAMLAVLTERLSEGAVAHSERVAIEAAKLAALYGVDVEDARLAGLLHDWHRETPGDELVARAEEAGVTVTDVDRAVPYLLHGPLAATELAAAHPDLGEAVLDAIGTHTYGGSPMSDLAMVVYVADITEPGRRTEHAPALRAMAGTASLPELFAEAYAESMHHLIDVRRRIHPATVETWNRIVGGELA